MRLLSLPAVRELGTAGLAVDPVVTAVRAYGSHLDPSPVPLNVKIHETAEDLASFVAGGAADVRLGPGLHRVLPLDPELL